MKPTKKIVLKRSVKEAKKYDASKDEMGNVLPEADVVTFTGSKKTQDRKRKLYNLEKKLSGLRGRLKGALDKRKK